MFLKSSFPIPTPSGFVAFDGGGPVEADAERVAADAECVAADALRVAAADAEPMARQASGAAVAAPAGLRQSPVWASSSGAAVRLVEGAVIAAICGYFAFGFAGMLGWF